MVDNKSKGLQWIVDNISTKYNVTTKVKNKIKKTLQDGIKSKDVIELLKSDAEYYGGVGKDHLSNSDIYTLLREPDKFGVAKEETKEMLVGRYFHAYILEPEKAKEYLVAPVSSRNSKAYKEFCADHLIPSALLKPEQEQCMSGQIKCCRCLSSVN